MKPEDRLPLTKCMAAGDLPKLERELQVVDPLFGKESQQDPARRWEYAMTLRTVLESGVLDKRGFIGPMALDVGGAGSPLHLMLGRLGFFHAHVIDPKVNFSLEGALQKGISAPFVACVSVIEHVPEIMEFVEQLRQAVTPGGVLFLTTDIWNERDDEPDRAQFHWMRERIFTPRTWQDIAEEFCRAGVFSLLGDHDFSYQETEPRLGYSFASMALRKR